jgi:N-acetylmuramic acid 6-phosphate etherase
VVASSFPLDTASVPSPLSKPPLDPRITEHRNPRTADIDLATPLEIVDAMNAEDRTVADAVARVREPIARAMGYVEEAFRTGGRLFYVGAGTSGRLGILDASECPPTFGSDPELVQGIIAGGDRAVFRSQEGAEDHSADGARAVDERGVRAGDVVVGIAASGTTPFVRGALVWVRSLGVRAVIVACTPVDDAFTREVDQAIIEVTGPEVVTGSTRLKAGTATKMILNMLTTGAMIRTGKTFGNLMVDLRATNVKLTDRAERMVMEVCDVSREAARDLLQAADRSVKLAIVMHAIGGSADDATRALAAHGGVIRKVLAATEGR